MAKTNNTARNVAALMPRTAIRGANTNNYWRPFVTLRRLLVSSLTHLVSCDFEGKNYDLAQQIQLSGKKVEGSGEGFGVGLMTEIGPEVSDGV